MDADSHGKLIWLTGLPASGKTTTATLLAAELERRGIPRLLLDGDEVRRGLCSDLGFSAGDRSENIRRAGEVARLATGSGLVCIAAFVSPCRADRERVRQRFAPGAFVEVHVKASLETCVRRDPKGLYARARRGLIGHFTGVTAPYEPPLSPEIEIDTELLSPVEAVGKILSHLGWR